MKLREAIEARDLPAALAALKAALGITWRGVAAELKASENAVKRWRNGCAYLSPGPWARIVELAGVVERGDGGDEEALATLQALRDAWPDGRGAWMKEAAARRRLLDEVGSRR